MGALVVQLVESWVYNPEDTGLKTLVRIPEQEERKHHNYSSPPADPSVRRVPGLVKGGDGVHRLWSSVCTIRGPCGHMFTLPVVSTAGCSCKMAGQASGDTIMLAPALEPA